MSDQTPPQRPDGEVRTILLGCVVISLWLLLPIVLVLRSFDFPLLSPRITCLHNAISPHTPLAAYDCCSGPSVSASTTDVAAPMASTAPAAATPNHQLLPRPHAPPAAPRLVPLTEAHVLHQSEPLPLALLSAALAVAVCFALTLSAIRSA
jgi:hypothetical protein